MGSPHFISMSASPRSSTTSNTIHSPKQSSIQVTHRCKIDSFGYYFFIWNNLPKSALTTPKLVGSVGRYKSAVNLSKDARSSSLNPHTLSNVFSIVHLESVGLSCSSHSLLPSAQSCEFASCLLLLHITAQQPSDWKWKCEATITGVSSSNVEITSSSCV